MTALAHPRRRPFWSDARFFIGLVLVALAVAGVWFVVSAARESAPLYAAARTIVPGEAVTIDDLRRVDAALGADAERYVAPGALAEGSVATRTVAEGELVPIGALGTAEQSRVTTVVVRSATAVPESVLRGSVVELWSAPAEEGGGYETPRILVADAIVAVVGEADGMLSDGAVTLELVIPRAAVSAALEAVAEGAALSVVPTAATR